MGDSLFIEVSRAAPDDDHVYRRMLSDGGYRTIADQYFHAISLQKVPDIIVERINKKLLKEYPKGTVLLISVSGDATYEDDDVVQGWLPKIRRSVKLGSFSAIYIVEEARSKLFKIF
ncbi:hypothetical protein [Komagataeibacter rhaeticus]|uniref:hypothetical protein n=1 Tax=Komagataeibacter rhaeticus TaxID=215221 RepID=UPI0015583D5D|nr:hypothetical protein [Komagataeibacter rhaeticus]